MIEIVFTESAEGSLKLAQSFGKGPYQGGCIGVLIHHKDGSKPTEEEIQEAQRRAEEKARAEWEQAVPLGGKSRDVFAFPMGLSVGNIREPLNLETRMDTMKMLWCDADPGTENRIREQFVNVLSGLEQVKSRIAAGEPIRIWYSTNPDELCGLYWLMDQLRDLPQCEIYGVKLPDWDETGDTIRTHTGWGDIGPGEFHRYLHLAQPISDAARKHFFANRWKQLQQENASLRACLNGKLLSVSEDIYDCYIRAEIARQPESFWEARVIGEVLGRHQLGIGDGWIHHRIEAMVRSGELQIVQPDPSGGYRRTLKKA